MSKSGTIFAFLLGAGIGSLVTWRIVKTKYEQLAEQQISEEVASVREMYRNLRRKNVTNEVTDIQEEAPADKLEAVANRYRPSEDDFIEKEDDSMEKPQFISPDDFGEEFGYDTRTFTYYADGVLTDEDDEVIRNVDDLVGSDFPSHFGDYEEDSVFVRNNEEKTDYEILRDLRRFSDVVGVSESE